MSTTTAPAPPAEAVARDAHWSAKMTRLRNRAPQRVALVFPDDDAAVAVREAGELEDDARRAARVDLLAADPDAEVTVEQVEADPRVVAALAGVEQAKAAQLEADVRITVQGLPADVYEDLVSAHPATPEQEERGELTYNVDRFAPALIAACCTDDMTPADAAALIGGEWFHEDTGQWLKEHALLTQGESAWLFQSCVQVNSNSRVYLAAAGKE